MLLFTSILRMRYQTGHDLRTEGKRSAKGVSAELARRVDSHLLRNVVSDRLDDCGRRVISHRIYATCAGPNVLQYSCTPALPSSRPMPEMP